MNLIRRALSLTLLLTLLEVIAINAGLKEEEEERELRRKLDGNVPGLFYHSNHQHLLNLVKSGERNLKIFIYPVPDETSVPLPHFDLEFSFPHYLYRLHRFQSDDSRYNMLVTNPEEANAYLIDCRWISHIHSPNRQNNIDPTVSYLLPIVNKVINSYPYFNRTMGADHFFIQTFDNGPFGQMVGVPPGDPQKTLFYSTMKRLAKTNFIGNYGMDLESFGNNPPGHRPGYDIVIPQPLPSGSYSQLRKLKIIRHRSFDSYFSGSLWGDRYPLYLMAQDAVYSYYFNGTEDYAYTSNTDDGTTSRLMSMAYFSYNSCGLGCWSRRLYHSMTELTIPIIVGDGIVQAFEKFINWKIFSLKMSSKTWLDQDLRTAYRRHIRKYCDEWRETIENYMKDPTSYTSLRARAGSIDFENIGRSHHEIFLESNDTSTHEEMFSKTLIWKKWQALALVWDWFDLTQPEKEINAFRLLALEIWCRIEAVEKDQGKRATVQEACLRPSDRSARQEWST
jgi:hypothetical protein